MLANVTVSKPVALVVLGLAALLGVGYTWRTSMADGADAADNATQSTQTAPTGSTSASGDGSAHPASGYIQRVNDGAGFLDIYQAQRLEEYLDGINQESGVDIRFIFERNLPDDLESYTTKRARELGLGRDMDRRSLLFVYDVGKSTHARRSRTPDGGHVP